MTEKGPWWADKTPEGHWKVDIPNLLFSIIIHELCVVDLLRSEDENGVLRTRDSFIDEWKAEILNLRQIDKITCVRASYYMFYNPRGSTRKDFPQRWKAAHEHIKYLFEIDLELAWQHMTDPPEYAIRMREESRKMFRKSPLTDEEKQTIRDSYVKK